MKQKAWVLIIGILATTAIILAGCSSPASTTSQAPAGTATASRAPTGAPVAATGSLEVRVTDAPPNPDITSVMVTVTSVQIHMAATANTTAATTAPTTLTPSSSPTESDASWITLKLSGQNSFDLLKIKGLEQQLALGDLAPGTYTQIRMAVSKVQVAISGGQLQDATIPSGNLKFVQPFEVMAGKATVLLFDFDAAKSVNVTGNGKIMFKPVIKLSVTRPGSMEIITPTLPNGEVGAAYNASLAAVGGTLPYTWNISSGSLPAGLSLNAATGVISSPASGPTGPGSFTFTITADDSNTVGKKSASKSYSIDIAAAGVLQITATSLPDGTNGVAYSATVQAVGGTGPYTWSMVNGKLPSGIALNTATGEISGTPTDQGNFNFDVKATDKASPANSDAQSLTLRISKDATQ